jgi:hypothetical protein
VSWQSTAQKYKTLRSQIGSGGQRIPTTHTHKACSRAESTPHGACRACVGRMGRESALRGATGGPYRARDRSNQGRVRLRGFCLCQRSLRPAHPYRRRWHGGLQRMTIHPSGHLQATSHDGWRCLSAGRRGRAERPRSPATATGICTANFSLYFTGSIHI